VRRGVCLPLKLERRLPRRRTLEAAKRKGRKEALKGLKVMENTKTKIPLIKKAEGAALQAQSKSRLPQQKRKRGDWKG